MLSDQITARMNRDLRSTLWQDVECGKAFDLAVADLARRTTPRRVTLAMQAGAAAAILEIAASRRIPAVELADRAVRRVDANGFWRCD